MDLQDLTFDDSPDGSDDENEDEDNMDPISAERHRRKKKQDHLRRTAGEPVKPQVEEVLKLKEGFLAMLRMVLAD